MIRRFRLVKCSPLRLRFETRPHSPEFNLIYLIEKNFLLILYFYWIPSFIKTGFHTKCCIYCTKMTARERSTSKMFGDLREIVEESHIFFPVKSADAEMLQCIHVLCSSCLNTIPSRTGKKSGDKMTCAVCKLDFDLPSRKVLREGKATKQLLSELSKVANDTKWCEICRKIYPMIWSEMSGKSALMYCPTCGNYECLSCARQYCRCHQTVALRSHLKEKPTNHGNHEWHKKRLEVYCIACDKFDCFLCLVDNVPGQKKNDFDKEIGLDIELQSLNALLQQLSSSKAQVKEQAMQFGLSVTMVKNEVEKSYTMVKNQLEPSHKERMRAMQIQKNSLLDQLRLIETKVKQELEQNRNIIDALLEKAARYRKSCDSIQSTGKLEEKFCALGAVLNKTGELKSELNSSIKLRRPTLSYDPEKSFGTITIEVHWTGKTR